MEPTTNKNIRAEPKQTHSIFKFFLNKSEDKDNDGNFIHEFLCQPRIPLIGKYQHSDYSFGSIISLMTITIPLNPKEKEKGSLNFPTEIFDYLNVTNILTIDDNTKCWNQNYFYPKAKVKFYFAISASPSSTGSQSQSNSDQFNIVPHMFLNPKLDFSKQKRVVYNTPMCLFVPKEIAQSSGVVFSNATKTDIDINNLRLEYSSIHMKGEALALSPNNLKFSLNTKMAINHFYLLVTQEKSEYHHLFYYIVVNNKDALKNVEEIVNDAKTLDEIINGFEAKMKEESRDIVDNLKKLFN